MDEPEIESRTSRGPVVVSIFARVLARLDD